MIKRLYTIDDNFNLDWVDIDIGKPLDDFGKIKYTVLSAKDESFGYYIHFRWINSKENPDGVWHNSIESLVAHLRRKTDQLEFLNKLK